MAVAGPGDPELVWDRYFRIENWPRWAPLISGGSASGETLEPGLTGKVRGPLGLRVDFEVDAVDTDERSWRWTVRSGPIRMELGHEVLSRPTGGSVATLELNGPAPVVLGYLLPATAALQRLVRA